MTHIGFVEVFARQSGAGFGLGENGENGFAKFFLQLIELTVGGLQCGLRLNELIARNGEVLLYGDMRSLISSTVNRAEKPCSNRFLHASICSRTIVKVWRSLAILLRMTATSARVPRAVWRWRRAGRHVRRSGRRSARAGDVRCSHQCCLHRMQARRC